MKRWPLLMTLLCAAPALAEDAPALFCPLDVEANPQFKGSVEALQKQFLSAARDRAGVSMPLRLEVDAAITATKLTDFKTNDASLAKLAVQGKVLYAGFVSLGLSPKNELVLTGRVVRDDGKLMSSAQVLFARGKESLPEALAFAAERLFTQLKTAKLPALRETVVAEFEPPPPPPKEEPPPMVVAPPATPRQSQLKTVGFVVAGVGAGVGALGGILYGTAGTVTRDASGNISVYDAPKVDGIRTQQGLGLGLLIGGGAVAVAGVVMSLVLSTQPPATVAVVPMPDGAVFAVSGTF